MSTETEAALRNAVIELRAKLAESNALVEWLRQRNDALAGLAEGWAQKLQDIEAAQQDAVPDGETGEETG